jgi:hypothetical protein
LIFIFYSTEHRFKSYPFKFNKTNIGRCSILSVYHATTLDTAVPLTRSCQKGSSTILPVTTLYRDITTRSTINRDARSINGTSFGDGDVSRSTRNANDACLHLAVFMILLYIFASPLFLAIVLLRKKYDQGWHEKVLPEKT